jgi:hypothetical protein
MNTKFICLLALMACAVARATPVVFQSAEQRTPLLELYTSEACSSCPPAEDWLSSLKSKPGLWTGFVPVAFHVDYWNHLGWRDRWSDEQFTERQQNYARQWSAADVYTPEFVLNGREWSNWSGWRGAPAASTTKAGVLRASSEDGRHWRADFVPAETAAADYEVTAALLVSEVSSDVDGGENAGRHLTHDFAALSLMTRPLTSGTNGYQGTFIIDPQPKGINGRLALAVWVTRAGQLEPLQATGGWLPAAGKN